MRTVARAVEPHLSCAMPEPDPPPPSPPPTLGAIFSGFFLIGICGFGGVLPWARWLLVERRQWLSADEFNDLLALCSFLPGPNIVNLSIAFGGRHHGVLGSAAAFFGLMGAPFCIALGLAMLYARFGGSPLLSRVCDAVAAAAAGMFLALAAKTAAPLFKRRSLVGYFFAALAFVGVGVLRLPLPWVMLTLAPLSILAAHFLEP